MTRRKGKIQVSENTVGKAPRFGCFGAKAGRNWSKARREVRLCTQEQARSCVCKGSRARASLNRDFKMGIPVYLKPVDEECDFAFGGPNNAHADATPRFRIFLPPKLVIYYPQCLLQADSGTTPRNAINRSWLVDRGTHDD